MDIIYTVYKIHYLSLNIKHNIIKNIRLKKLMNTVTHNSHNCQQNYTSHRKAIKSYIKQYNAIVLTDGYRNSFLLNNYANSSVYNILSHMQLQITLNYYMVTLRQFDDDDDDNKIIYICI